MKRRLLLPLLLMVALCAGALVGCAAKPTPTEVTTDFLEAIKSNDTDALAKVYSGNSGDFSTLNDVSAGGEEWMASILDGQMLPMVREFDYEITDEQISDSKDTATVDVKVTTYSFGTAFTDFFDDFMTQGVKLMLNGGTEAELDDLAAQILNDKLAGMAKDYTKDVTINLTKVDGDWKVDSMGFGDSIVDALLGGALEAIDSYGQDSQ